MLGMAGFAVERPLILVAADGTPSSLRAGSYAVSLARHHEARLICLYVNAPPVVVSASGASIGTAIKEARAVIGEELRRFVTERAGDLGLDATFIERSGNPYAEIVKVATELQVDTIVVGASAQAGHRVIGSIGARLIRNAHWPVTVVP
jgi:nucleotide-binding universal stress UspA family protein